MELRAKLKRLLAALKPDRPPVRKNHKPVVEQDLFHPVKYQPELFRDSK